MHRGSAGGNHEAQSDQQEIAHDNAFRKTFRIIVANRVSTGRARFSLTQRKHLVA